MSEQTSNEEVHVTSARTKYVLVGVIVLLAFFAAYGFASARSGGQEIASAQGQGVYPAVNDSGYAEGEGGCGEGEGGCCGGSSEPIEASTTMAGDVQTMDISIADNTFDPNTIYATAGVPIEFTIGEGSGCMAEFMFPEFDVFEDLTQGGAVVQLPAMQPGEYSFSCGMEMVFGTLVVE